MSAHQKSTPSLYLSNGRMLASPPLTARIVRWVDNIYLFLGLYFVSLFAIDSYGAAESSQFNIAAPHNNPNTRPRWGGSSGGSGGGRPGGGGGGPGGRRVGRVDDIRGPECKSCQ